MLKTIIQNTDKKGQRCAVCQFYLNDKKIKDDQINITEPNTMFTDWGIQYTCQFSTKMTYRFKATLIKAQ